MAEIDELAFKTGYLLACCNLTNLHDRPEIACDVLAEAGITRADVKAMGLSEYDAIALREIRRARGPDRDPIGRNRPKSRSQTKEKADG